MNSRRASDVPQESRAGCSTKVTYSAAPAKPPAQRMARTSSTMRVGAVSLRLGCLPTPRLEEQMRHDQRLRILDVVPEGELEIVELGSADELLREEPRAQVLDEVQHDRPARMPHPVDVHQRSDLDVEQAGSTQQPWQPAADEQVDAVRPGVRLERLHQARPGGQRRIDDVQGPGGLLARDDSPRR